MLNTPSDDSTGSDTLMWKYLRNLWQGLSTPREQPSRAAGKPSPHRILLFEARSAAQTAGRKPYLVAIYSASGKHKWAYFMCPCGCGQQLALNLMPSQRPVWRVTIRSEADFSIFPSVDSTTCGAHFWLRAGRITWSDYE